MNEWIAVRGSHDEPTLEVGTKIDVKYRDGTLRPDVPFMSDAVTLEGGNTRYGTSTVFWDRDDAPNDIVAYRLSECRSPYCECPVGECKEGKVDNRGAGLVDWQVARDNVGEVIKVSIPDATVPDIPNVNPKQGIGSTKLPLHLVNGLTVAYTAVGLANGKLKYGKGNYMATPVIASIYLDAMERHLASFKAGEEVDPDDGVPHIAAILANCDIILNARAMGTLIDDRGIGTGYLKERDKLTEIYQSLVKLHEDKNPKHYTLENA